MTSWLQIAKRTRLFTVYFYHLYERHAVVMNIRKGVKVSSHNQINIILLCDFNATCFGLSTKNQFDVQVTVHRDKFL